MISCIFLILFVLAFFLFSPMSSFDFVLSTYPNLLLRTGCGHQFIGLRRGHSLLLAFSRDVSYMSFFYLLARASMGLGWLRTQQHLCRRKSRNFSLGWREVQILVQKGLLNFLGANYLSPHPLPLVTEKAETTTCFSICESQLPLAREIHRLLRVPKDNHIF